MNYLTHLHQKPFFFSISVMEEGAKVLTTQTEARQNKGISSSRLRGYKGRFVSSAPSSHSYWIVQLNCTDPRTKLPPLPSQASNNIFKN